MYQVGDGPAAPKRRRFVGGVIPSESRMRLVGKVCYADEAAIVESGGLHEYHACSLRFSKENDDHFFIG